MLLDTYFYHLSRAIPAHECEQIIAYGKSLNPKEAETTASKSVLSDEEKQTHSQKIRSSKTAFIGDVWLKKDLSDVKVINHGNMQFRRIYWTLNLTYSTTQKELAQICESITEYLANSEQLIVNPDQESFARTAELAASSIDIMVLCYATPVGLTDFSKIIEDVDSFGKLPLNVLEFHSPEPENSVTEKRSKMYNWFAQAAYFTKPSMKRLFTGK